MKEYLKFTMILLAVSAIALAAPPPVTYAKVDYSDLYTAATNGQLSFIELGTRLKNNSTILSTATNWTTFFEVATNAFRMSHNRSDIIFKCEIASDVVYLTNRAQEESIGYVLYAETGIVDLVMSHTNWMDPIDP